MKIIELTRGKRSMVDDEDYEYLSQWEWVANNSAGCWYAVRYENLRAIMMHRVISGIEMPSECDHKNRDGLDNRRENLRLCTRTQNQQNRRGWMRRDARRPSVYKGVSWESRKGRRPQCVGRIRVNGQQFRKRFKEEEAAALWYDQMAAQHFGEFAQLNFA